MRDLVRDETDAAIVTSTIGLGHALGLTVGAAGVEDHETWERLAGLGCDLAQGYYLSRPLPPDEVERWLDAAAVPAVPARAVVSRVALMDHEVAAMAQDREMWERAHARRVEDLDTETARRAAQVRGMVAARRSVRIAIWRPMPSGFMDALFLLVISSIDLVRERPRGCCLCEDTGYRCAS